MTGIIIAAIICNLIINLIAYFVASSEDKYYSGEWNLYIDYIFDCMTTCLFTIGLIFLEIGVYYYLVKSIKEIQQALQEAKKLSRMAEDDKKFIPASAFTSTDLALVPAYRYSADVELKKPTLSKTAATPKKGESDSRISSKECEPPSPILTQNALVRETVPTSPSLRSSTKSSEPMSLL